MVNREGNITYLVIWNLQQVEVNQCLDPFVFMLCSALTVYCMFTCFLKF